MDGLASGSRRHDAWLCDEPRLPRPAILGQCARSMRFRLTKKARSSKSAGGWLRSTSLSRVGFFIFMYKFLPLLAATELKRVNPIFGEQIMFNLVDGVIRIALFLLFIWGVSLMR